MSVSEPHLHIEMACKLQLIFHSQDSEDRGKRDKLFVLPILFSFIRE